MSTAPKYRAMRYGITRVRLDDTPHGVQYVQAEQALQAHPERMTDKLLHWARETPERTFLARRKRLPDGRTGDWEQLSYGRALAGARRIGQAVLARILSA
jgi:feruloyl-CoA synthase